MLNWRGPEPGPGPVVITMEVTEMDNLETYFIKLFDVLYNTFVYPM